MKWLVLVILATLGTVVTSDQDPDFEPAQYSFRWQVQDEPSNNDYGQTERREGDKTEGSYYVQLPDGRTQKVTYTVDGYSGKIRPIEGASDNTAIRTGFQANVEFLGDIVQPAVAASAYKPVRVQPPRRKYRPRPAQLKKPARRPVARPSARSDAVQAVTPRPAYREPEQVAVRVTPAATTQPTQATVVTQAPTTTVFKPTAVPAVAPSSYSSPAPRTSSLPPPGQVFDL